jgi:nucleotide-binding universal stress UspA family protein
MAPTKILCATDFSPLSLEACHAAAGLAARFGAALVVLHVDPQPELAALGPDFAALIADDLDTLRRGRDRYVEANLRKLASELRSHHDIEVTTELLHDRAADGIVRRAKSGGADLIVVGHHGAGAHRLLLGSVAARVARTTQTPTLVIPESAGRDRIIGTRILAAVDLVEGDSLAVANAALELAGRGARLELFNVFYEPVLVTVDESIAVGAEMTRIVDAAKTEIRRQLDGLAKQLDAKDVEIGVALDHGSPPRAVLARADTLDADLIAVGTHGRHGVERLIGTTAERVLRAAAVPVLVVPTGDES